MTERDDADLVRRSKSQILIRWKSPLAPVAAALLILSGNINVDILDGKIPSEAWRCTYDIWRSRMI